MFVKNFHLNMLRKAARINNDSDITVTYVCMYGFARLAFTLSLPHELKEHNKKTY